MHNTTRRMAIANGTCVSFCNQPKAHYLATHESHADMSLPSADLRALQHLATSRESKAHFGLPWVRPWDYRGKCYTDGKRIQCLSNASQHIFNRCLVIQPGSSKVRHFSTFFAHFGLPCDNRGKCFMDGKRIQCL